MTDIVDDDVKKIEELIASLDEEEAALVDVADQMRNKIETEAGPNLDKIDEYEDKLLAVKKQADDEEQQGGIAAAQAVVDQQ